jgi:hypothetical protein
VIIVAVLLISAASPALAAPDATVRGTEMPGAWLESQGWRELTALWDDAFRRDRPAHGALEARRQALEDRLAHVPPPLEEPVRCLRKLLAARLRSLAPPSHPGVMIRQARPDPDREARESAERLDLHLCACRGLRDAGSRDPWLERVLVPDLAVALLIAEQRARADGVTGASRRIAKVSADRARAWLGPRHPLLPEERLARWEHSAAWAAFKALYTRVDRARTPQELAPDPAANAHDRWSTEMSSALPNREDLAAALSEALVSLRRWRDTRLDGGFDPRREDAVEQALSAATAGHRALGALRAMKAADPWIEAAFAPSVASAVDALAAQVAAYRAAGGTDRILLARVDRELTALGAGARR